MSGFDFGAKLTRGGFGSKQSEDIKDDAVKIISVTLDDISFFSLNPRRSENPKFEEIKESIRVIGLENPLTLTKRPGEAGYTLFNGGNTRLKALKELWKETADPRFYQLDCRFVKWQSDSETLIRHMIENETRGEMLLIDKAMAALQIKQLYEQETGENLSLRKLGQLLKEKGWSVGHGNLSTFIFTAEKLSNRIPLALQEGLDKSKIEAIRKVYHAIKTYCDARLPSHESVNSEALQRDYLEFLAQYDEPNLGHEQYALDDVASKIQKIFEIDAFRVNFEINHILEHGELYQGGTIGTDFNEIGQPIKTDVSPPTFSDTDGYKEATATDNLSYSDTATAHASSTEAANEIDSSHTATGNNAEITVDAGQSSSAFTPATEMTSSISATEQLQTTLRYLRVEFPSVAEIILETSETPFFTLNNDVIALFKLMLNAQDNQKEDKSALLISLYDFACAYAVQFIDTPIWNNIYKQLLELEPAMREHRNNVISMQYGFYELPKNAEKVLRRFQELGQELRQYTLTLTEVQGWEK